MGLSINILATVAVVAVVFFLPLIDRRVCKKLGVQPSNIGGIDRHQRRLLLLRTGILHVIFLLYGLTVAYLTIFSRSAGEEYLIHIALMNDMREAITFDTTYIGVLESILENGLVTGLSNIHIENIADVSQVYLNIMLFIPFGYLAPYCFARFRTRPILRPLVAGFVVSFFVENLQLILKR
ncbi:MAG: VanZ family protein, partial [Oscillospiraceae bacterium]|nr:VanZ family protein [Oscillospiraceae bacterium]